MLVAWSEVYSGFYRKGDERHGKPGWRRAGTTSTSTSLPATEATAPSLPSTSATSVPPAAEQSQRAAVEEDAGLEFNTSHQAGLVALVGTPNVGLELGVDVTCPFESTRPQSKIKTNEEFEKWVDNFTDVFSVYDIREMRSRADGDVKKKLRKFYTHWALKEAYIKMTGEALLASWLKELEFRDVRAPDLPSLETGDGGLAWGKPVRARAPGVVDGDGVGDGEAEDGVFDVIFGERRVEGVEMEVRSLVFKSMDGTGGEGEEEEWIVAVCVRGGRDGGGNVGSGGRLLDHAHSDDGGWKEVRIQDMEPCAMGRCLCLGG
jgi:4'-phosphopantetheinyl transferase